MAKIARALGLPLMPWQLYTATVGGEVWPAGSVLEDEDVSGQYVRPLVIVSVPRQSGKSALMLAQGIHRCLARPDQQVWFTAQTGKDAADLYRAFVARVLKSPLAEWVHGKPAYRGGSECLTFWNGSTLRPFAPGRDALHGKQSDHVSIDEGWAFSEDAGADLFQAIAPTKSTRPGAQTWIWSTRGDAASTWFHALVDRGAAGDPDVALFDWGVPDGVDVDLDAVVAHHPAFRHTQTRSSIRAGMAEIGWDKPAELARAYGNRASGARELVLPADAWARARTLEDLPEGRPAYGVAVAHDGSASSLVAAVAGPDGVPVVELLEHRPGRAWLARAVLELAEPGQVAVDRRGPAGPTADALELAGVELLPLSTVDYAAACQDLFDRVVEVELGDTARFRHRDHPALDAAVDVAARRLLPEGGWVWSRKRSTGDVSPLEAATLAARAVARAPAPFVLERAVFVS